MITKLPFPSQLALFGLIGLAIAANSPRPVVAAENPPMTEVARPSGSGGYTFSSNLAIGGPNAPDEAQFFEKLGRVAVDADAAGNIYVLDNGNLRIQVFDPSGKFLRGFGREGEGPGEFKMPTCLSVNAKGEIALYDMMNQRVSVLDSTGKLLRDEIMERPVRDLFLQDDGGLVLAYGGPLAPKFEALDRGGKSVWKFGGEAPNPDRAERVLEFNIGGAAGSLGVVGGTTYAASDQVYGIHKIEGGRMTAGFRRPFERQAMPTMADLARERRGKDDGAEEEGSGPRVVMITREESGDGNVSTSVRAGEAGEHAIELNGADIANLMPKFQADLTGLLVFPDGRIWAMTSEKEGDKVVTDEWSGGGEYRRRFTLDDTYDSYEIGADGRLYGVAHDKDDFPIVHRIELKPEG
ncbi:MAG: 6-bladed beta-propeller [Candidatus Eisenbacteria bacterium]|nr:6-bladed beta-propeller [Candidatus Eisenbacteria bacterium]